MVQKNQNRYEWKMPLELVFLVEGRTTQNSESQYTTPFRMTSHSVYYTSQERVY